MSALQTVGTVVIGLTGGMASGKSTVARILVKMGFPVLDTDGIGHELMNSPGSVVQARLVARFGRHIIDAQGLVDRPTLAADVFADPKARSELEAILHPAISDEVWQRVSDLAGTSPLVFLEVPLLIEAGWDKKVRWIVVVDCPPEDQVTRFMTRTGSDQESAEARLKTQISRAERLARADYVIDNSGPVSGLRSQVLELLVVLTKEMEADD